MILLNASMSAYWPGLLVPIYSGAFEMSQAFWHPTAGRFEIDQPDLLLTVVMLFQPAAPFLSFFWGKCFFDFHFTYVNLIASWPVHPRTR